MTLAPWRSRLARALHHHRSQPQSRYLQLATVRLDGKPANRTVVFRGFLESTDQLKFVTDRRSQKIAQIQQADWAEACWYFEQTREQFRILGQLILVDQDYTDPELQKSRQLTWQALSDAARLQFAWPEPGSSRSEAIAFQPSSPDPSQPLETFCLLLLDPWEVDHLELRGEPQNRHHYSRMQGWSLQEINP